MKKMLIVLAALLIAAPVMAVVNITCTEITPGIVRVSYQVSGETFKMRALALDVSVDSGCIISDIRKFKVGESGQSNGAGDPIKGYGIFPGSISFPGPVWGDPIAPASDPGAAGTGKGKGRVITEQGSLYDANVPTKAPLDDDDLFDLVIDPNGASGCTLTITKEVTNRGGIVMENSASPTGGDNLPQSCALTFGCFPTTHAHWSQYRDVGGPASWCNPRQCHGDADGAQYMGKWVFGPDLNVLIAGWNQVYSGDPTLDGPDAGTDPDTWISADFNHLPYMEKRVFGPDLNVIITYWNADVVPADCLD